MTWDWNFIMGVYPHEKLGANKSNRPTTSDPLCDGKYGRGISCEYVRGWDTCPCDEPQCHKRPKCEKEAVMCLAFEEWSTGGSYKAEIGKWLVPTTEMHHANKARRSGKRAKLLYFRKVYDMFKEGNSQEQVAIHFGITKTAVGTIVNREKVKENFRES